MMYGFLDMRQALPVIHNEDLDYLAGNYPLRNPHTGEPLIDREGVPVANPRYFDIMAEKERQAKRLAERVKRYHVDP